MASAPARMILHCLLIATARASASAGIPGNSVTFALVRRDYWARTLSKSLCLRPLTNSVLELDAPWR